MVKKWATHMLKRKKREHAENELIEESDWKQSNIPSGKIKCREWIIRRVKGKSRTTNFLWKSNAEYKLLEEGMVKSRATHVLKNQMGVIGHKKSTVKSRATHMLRNQMTIMGYKKSGKKSRATYRLRNKTKMLGHKKSTAKVGNSQAKKPNEDDGTQEECSKKQETHRLRNQMKIMGQKKSTAKSRQLTS